MCLSSFCVCTVFPLGEQELEKVIWDHSNQSKKYLPRAYCKSDFVLDNVSEAHNMNEKVSDSYPAWKVYLNPMGHVLKCSLRCCL